MQKQNKGFAKILVGLPVEGPFDYRVPEGLVDEVRIGKRVWVPFGNRRIVGYIVGLADTSNVKETKQLYEVIDREPIVDSHMLELTRQISKYYLCSWGQAIEAAIPGSLRKGRRMVISRVPSEPESLKPSVDLTPTHQQDRILKGIWECLEKRRHQVFLLHGITGSGKTEVYLQSIGFALQRERSSIVLVPEISLTPQAVERFKSRFGEEVAILHSRMTGGERFSEWKKVKDRKARIVVGARSAVFAPVHNLGLIVVDEEHETSYKQQDVPRYHAREVAIMRASLSRAVVILGSATPSLESYHKAKKGIYRLMELTERIEQRRLPQVQIIDMRKEPAKFRRLSIFSKSLEDGLRDVLANKGQAILFLNRRGFSTFVNCKKCGLVLRCKYCSVSLVFHFQSKRLVCHWCNFQMEPPQICPQCRSSYIRYFGMGTQKVESETHRLFLEAKVGRMDTDATAKRGSHKRILTDFKEGHIDLLIGTQMIAKGLDYPRVTLVGVVSADTALNLPDFRASERTFSLLTQVAGRAGRGLAPGKVVIQSYTPGHYAILAASRHDYEGFYKQEVAQRRQLALPPFTHIVNLTLRGRNQDKTLKAAEQLAGLLRQKLKTRKVSIIGPAPAAIPRLRRHYWWNIYIKGKRPSDLCCLVKEVLKVFKRPSGMFLAVNVDPL